MQHDYEKDRYASSRDRPPRTDDRYSSSRYDDRYGSSRRGDDRGAPRHEDYSRRRYDDDRGDRERRVGRRDDDYGDRDRRGYRGSYDDRRGDDRRGRGGGGGGGGGDFRGGRDSGRDAGARPPSQERRSSTPEGAVPLSKRARKASGWDLHAAGYENYTAMQAKATGMFNLPGANRQQPVPHTLAPPPDAPAPAAPIYFPQAAAFSGGLSASNPNLARQSRRLYVGSITYDANEENIAAFFNAKMKETGLGTDAPGESVVGVQINHEKSYAFVEFKSPEDATAAMGLDGVIFQAAPLKIRRPKDYAGPDPLIPIGFHVPGVVSTNVPDSINKIFVGGLPTYLNDEQVMELLKSFGELKAFNLVKEGNTNISKGFAFFEYVDPGVTDVAVQGLNGMQLGERYLVVQRAAIGAKSTMPGGPGMPSAEEYQNALNAGRRPAAIPRALELDGGEVLTSRILLMLNMVTPEDLMDDTEYTEILEDIRAECSSFGEVDDLRIPRPAKRNKGASKWSAGGASESGPQKTDEELGVGKVYVKYRDPAGARQGLASLAGRAFAGRSIVATLLADDADVQPSLADIFAVEGRAPEPMDDIPPPPPMDPNPMDVYS